MRKVQSHQIKQIFSDKTIRPYINNQDRIQEGKYPIDKYQTIHHILSKSNDGTNDTDNKIALFDSLHISLHNVFGTLYVAEQIAQILLINESALCDEFKADLLEVLQKRTGDYPYKGNVAKNIPTRRKHRR